MTARDILTIGSKDKPPVLFTKDFKIWKDRFLDYVERQENGALIHDSLMNGVQGPVYSKEPDQTDDEGEEETAALAKMCLMSKDGEDSDADAAPETNEIVI